jgi:8-oxo-dGTP diphosphatase
MAAGTPELDRNVYIVRHAHAGRRTSAADDAFRSLSGRGRREAARVSEILGSRVSGPILSSPYPRCVETVRPLADRLRTDVELRDELAEGADLDRAVRLLDELPGDSVACVHGALMSELADQLRTDGCHIEEPISLAKGVVWALMRADGQPVRLRVLRAPDSTDTVGPQRHEDQRSTTSQWQSSDRRGSDHCVEEAQVEEAQVEEAQVG